MGLDYCMPLFLDYFLNILVNKQYRYTSIIHLLSPPSPMLSPKSATNYKTHTTTTTCTANKPRNSMFEIRVAVIGYVSVGKTTLINALLGQEFGEVGMQRTTSVVHSFGITSPSNTSSPSAAAGEGEEESSSSDSDSFLKVGDDDDSQNTLLSATVALKETKADNANFRDSTVVHEHRLEIGPIRVDHRLLQHPMRPDTQLVLVDIPGINEAGGTSSSKFKDYVTDHWHTFDVVVLLMDAREGVRTEEQRSLLQLAKDNNSSANDVPLIILQNKVDDPENEEQQLLLGEAREAIAELFGVSDRQTALQTTLQKMHHHHDDASISPPPQNNDTPEQHDMFPVVVPMSAMYAFCYRCGSQLSYEEFCQMDRDFIDKIGKDSYGRQWRRWDKQEQLLKAYQAVSNAEECQYGLEASNFGPFTKVLSICIGDENHQTKLIEKQIDVALSKIQNGTAISDSDLVADLLLVHKKLQALGKSTDHLAAVFWSSYERLKTKAFEDFQRDFSVHSLAIPMDQLFDYYKNALTVLQWPLGETEKVIDKAKEMVLQYAVGVTTSEHFQAKHQNDQAMILGSMLLASSETFHMHFGVLKLHLESKYKFDDGLAREGYCCQKELKVDKYGKGTEYCTACETVYVQAQTTDCPHCLQHEDWGVNVLSWKIGVKDRRTAYCNYCEWSFEARKGPPPTMKVENAMLVPVDEEAYKEYLTVVVPESLKDPSHFGYVLWKCCQLLKALENEGSM